MSDMPQEIALFQKVKNESARKRLNIKAAFFWCTSKKESLALSRMALAMDEAGFDDEDFARPIRVNLPVVDDLPDEGVFDTTFCDRYQLGDDGMTFGLIPGAAPLAPAGEKVVEGTDTTVVDGVDTQTGEIVDHEALDAATSGGETPDPDLRVDEDDDDKTEYPVAEMEFSRRLLSQFISDATAHHINHSQRVQIIKLSLDDENHYVQNLLLAVRNTPELEKLSTAQLWKFTDAIKTVFHTDKRHELSRVIQFAKLWASTEHIDRGILTREWAEGNYITVVNRTPSGANAGGVIHSDRLTPQTILGLEYEIALGILAREHEFDIYNVPLPTEFLANNMMNKMENKEFLATRELFVSMPGGLDYSRACNIATVKTTPEGLWKDPPRHREHLNRVMTETDHAHPAEHVVDIACGRSSSPMPMAPIETQQSEEEINQQLAAERGDYVEGISDPNAPNWVHENLNQAASNEGEKQEVETTSDVQIQEVNSHEESAGDALHPGESGTGAGEETVSLNGDDAIEAHGYAMQIMAANAPSLANHNEPIVDHFEDFSHQDEPEQQQSEPDPQPEWPTHFEPGRYEGVPNEVYHSANGISSTMLKDVRISAMYYNARHVEKTIPREETKAFLFGGHSHAFILEPGKIDAEYAVPTPPPEGMIRTTADMSAIIKEHNDALPALMTPDELKSWIENYNSGLTPPLSLSGNSDETGLLYMSLPEEYQRIPADGKQTATAQKACIKEYNSSLTPMLKLSGTREQLLDQISTVAPELAAKERAKPQPYNTSGNRAQLIEAVRQIRPDVVLSDDFEAEQERIRAGRIYISLEMYEHVKAVEKAVFSHPGASRLLNHPSRQSEVSYFGFDEETGLEIRVRPDVELQLQYSRIGADLKTVQLGQVKQERLRERLHREIIERDYHLSAAMYSDLANFNQFFWIFVNKDPGYHWVAVIEASAEELELGRLEYRRALRTINDCTMSGNWPAPITEDYTDELNDFDLRRLEALGAM
ncbi:RecE family exodeoxyribonuclease [Yokenella regensburgei]|uniref:RecE family exodeoxyribonuclease n=1 Tax=Yokenella regensburgei TaxID=158877 RepID=UPI0014328973|nr:RecE family exodeoxyribonuclease [Yokenella regensburgei]QIU88250.1 exodeoxyribonuclease [Yokenella regensburgei]